MNPDLLIGIAIGLASGIFASFASIGAILYFDHRRIIRHRRD